MALTTLRESAVIEAATALAHNPHGGVEGYRAVSESVEKLEASPMTTSALLTVRYRITHAPADEAEARERLRQAIGLFTVSIERTAPTGGEFDLALELVDAELEPEQTGEVA